MALVVDGVPVSGSTGNNTYSRNRYGAYRRRRVKPVNPQSMRQTAQRMRFTVAVAAWYNTLTSLQQIAWNNWAVATPWLNKAGQTVRLSGQAAWIRYCCAVMTANANAALPGTIDPPIENNCGSIYMSDGAVAYDATPAAEKLTITFQAPAPPVNSGGANTGLWIVSFTPGYSSGVNFPGSRFTLANAFTGASWAAGVVTAEVATGDLPSLPYLPAIGSRVWIKGRSIAPIATDRRVSYDFVLGPITVTEAG